MSEHEPQIHSPERRSYEAESHKDQQEKLKQLSEKAAEAKEKSSPEVERLAHHAKEKAVSGKERSVGDIGKESSRHPTVIIDKTVKRQAYKKTLRHVQRQLPRSQRSFSRFIHQDMVDKVSEASSKTIARPSGLLGGGVVALLGTSVVVWMSRYYGFRYNFFVFVALIVAGFVAGILVEALLKSSKKLFRRG